MHNCNCGWKHLTITTLDFGRRSKFITFHVTTVFIVVTMVNCETLTITNTKIFLFLWNLSRSHFRLLIWQWTTLFKINFCFKRYPTRQSNITKYGAFKTLVLHTNITFITLINWYRLIHWSISVLCTYNITRSTLASSPRKSILHRGR